MQSIPVGTKGSFSLVVAPDHLANRFKDATLPPVLATPVMIMVMENAALNAIKPYLDAGESALGTRVDVRHLAATPSALVQLALPSVLRRPAGRLERRSAVDRERERVESLAKRRVLTDAARALRDLYRRVDDLTTRLTRAVRGSERQATHRLSLARNALRSLNPVARIANGTVLLAQLRGRPQREGVAAPLRRRGGPARQPLTAGRPRTGIQPDPTAAVGRDRPQRR